MPFFSIFVLSAPGPFEDQSDESKPDTPLPIPLRHTIRRFRCIFVCRSRPLFKTGRI